MQSCVHVCRVVATLMRGLRRSCQCQPRDRSSTERRHILSSARMSSIRIMLQTCVVCMLDVPNFGIYVLFGPCEDARTSSAHSCVCLRFHPTGSITCRLIIALLTGIIILHFHFDSFARASWLMKAVDLSRFVMVGDDFNDDVAGSMDTGMEALSSSATRGGGHRFGKCS